MPFVHRLASRLSARLASVVAALLAILAGTLVDRVEARRPMDDPYVTITISPNMSAGTTPVSVSVTLCNLTGIGDPPEIEYGEMLSIAFGLIEPSDDTEDPDPTILEDLTSSFTRTYYTDNYPGCSERAIYESSIGLEVGEFKRLFVRIETDAGSEDDPYVTAMRAAGYYIPGPPPEPKFDPLTIAQSVTTPEVCAANCFDARVSYSTPAYFSLDAPRSLPLIYSSQQAQTRHTIAIGIEDTTILPIMSTSIRLKRPNDSYVTFTNDSTTMVFDGYDGNTLHGVQFNEDLATGAYSFTAEIISVWNDTTAVLGDTTITLNTPVSVRFLVVNERASPYGAGWSIPGLQRVHTTGIGSSVVLTGGDGSIAYFHWTGSAYTSPATDFTTLHYRASPDTIGYERRYPDSTKAYFRASDGRLSYMDDRFGNRTAYQYSSGAVTTITDPAGKTITLAYTSTKLDSIVDPGGRVTQITIDGSGDLTQIQDPAGGKPLQSMTYSDHRMINRTDRRGGTWTFAYDYTGKLAADSTPAVTAGGTYGRLVTTYSAPQRDYLVDPASGDGTEGNPAPSVFWDAAFGEGSVTNTVNQTTTMSVDYRGAPIYTDLPNGERESIARDAYGRTKIIMTDATEIHMGWSGVSLVADTNVKTSEVRKRAYSSTYPTLVTRDSGRVITNSWYGSLGKLDSTKIEGKGAMKFTYDGMGRMATSISPDADTIRFYRDATSWKNIDSVNAGTWRSAQTYDSYGRTITKKNALNHVDSTFYDALNRVTRVGGPLGHTISYAYEDSLNLTKVTDANLNVHKLEKNAVGWDTAKVDPRGKKDFFLYTKQGKVSHWINRKGDTTTYKYDAQGRDSVRTLADTRVTTYGYGETGPLGIWRWASNAEGTDTIRTNRDTTYEISVRGGTKYQTKSVYNKADRDLESTVSQASGWSRAVTYDYDSTGVLKRIVQPNSVITTLAYTTDNQVASVALPVGDTLRNAFRFTNTLARASHTNGTVQASQGMSYNHDVLSRVVEGLTAGRDTVDRFEYDALGRLTARRRHTLSPACTADTTSELGAACFTGGQPKIDSLLYTYDALGNRTDRGAVLDTANRLRRFDGDTLFYDDNGSLIRKYRIADSSVFNQRLYWNSIGQLDSVRTTISGTTTSVRYGYDGFGRRARRGAMLNLGTGVVDTTRYLYQREHVIAEISGSGTLTKTYTYHSGTDRPHGMHLGSGARYYFLSDGRGNITGVLDSTSALVATYRYTPGGKLEATTGSVPNVMLFAGRDLDAQTGLYHNRARYYDPTIGRFIREDPAGFRGGINLYAYAGGDPVNFADPLGLWPFPNFNWAEGGRNLVAGIMALYGTMEGDANQLAAIWQNSQLGRTTAEVLEEIEEHQRSIARTASAAAGPARGLVITVGGKVLGIIGALAFVAPLNDWDEEQMRRIQNGDISGEETSGAGVDGETEAILQYFMK